MKTKVFVFSVEGFDFLNFIIKWQNLYGNLREFSPCYSKIGFQFCKLTFLREVDKLFVNLRKYKQNIKVSVGIKSGKCLLTSCVLDSLTSMIE